MTSETAWVVDASVALKWFLEDEDHVENATRLLRRFASGDVDLTAPYFIRYEVASALEMAHVQQRITSADRLRKLSAFLSSQIYAPRDDDALLIAATDLSGRYRISPYDAVYLALAARLDCLYVTADARLFERIESAVPFARWVGHVS